MKDKIISNTVRRQRQHFNVYTAVLSSLSHEFIFEKREMSTCYKCTEKSIYLVKEVLEFIFHMVYINQFKLCKYMLRHTCKNGLPNRHLTTFKDYRMEREWTDEVANCHGQSHFTHYYWPNTIWFIYARAA